MAEPWPAEVGQMCPPGRAKRPVQSSRELEHPSAPCNDSQLEPRRDWESRGVGDRRQARGADKAPCHSAGAEDQVGSRQSRSLKDPQASSGRARGDAAKLSPEPWFCSQHSQARSRTSGESGREKLRWQSTGKDSARPPEGPAHRPCRASELCAPPAQPSPARTRLDETLGLGDGAVCRAIGRLGALRGGGLRGVAGPPCCSLAPHLLQPLVPLLLPLVCERG